MALQILSITSLMLAWMMGLLIANSESAGEEKPELLTKKTIDTICNMSQTSFCTGSSTDPDATCSEMGKNAERNNNSVLPEARCDQVNACSFLALVNGTYNSLVYVSYQNKSVDADNSSRTYKKCKNGLIVYSLYP